MSVRLSLQQQLVAFYENTKQDDWARLQKKSNAISQSTHPIATLMHDRIEVQFFHKVDDSLYADVYARAKDEVIKRIFIDTVLEDHIVHGGWIYNTRVSEMGKSQKDAFIKKIANMRVYKHKNEDIFLC